MADALVERGGRAAVSGSAGVDSEHVLQDGKKWSILVGTMTGGQGKTLSSQLLAMNLVDHALEFSIGSVDAPESDKQLNSSKLQRALENSVDGVDVWSMVLDTDAETLRDAMFDGALLHRHFEDLAMRMLNGNTIIDLGANLIDGFLSWMRVYDKDNDIMKSVDRVVVIPITAGETSQGHALRTVQMLREMRSTHPMRIVIIRNGFHGEVTWEGSAGTALNAIIKRDGIAVVDLSHCKAQGIRAAESLTGGLRALSRADAQMYAQRIGARSPFQSAADRDIFTEWVRNHIKEFDMVSDLIESR